MLNIGGWELMIILLVGLVVLGPQRLPEVARQLGQTVSSLRSLASGFQAELEAAANPDVVSAKANPDVVSSKTEPDVASAMTLQGPTPQAEAIAATQPAGGPGDDTAAADSADDDVSDIEFAEAAEITADPFAGRHTDPYDVATAARKVTYDDDANEAPTSPGGPTDLRDEEE